MAMETKMISQKEYLKKYMSFDDDDNKKKKKKKKHKTGARTVKIIDDDIDLKNIRPIEEDEFDILLEGEDAPQIAGIVDERGPVDFTDKKRWKIITKNEEGDLDIISCTTNKERRNQNDEMNANQNKIDDDLDLNLSKMKHSKNKYTDSSVHRQSKNDDSDLSPYRRSKYSKNKHVDLKSSRRRTDYDSDSCSPEQLKNYDSDVNLPKRSRNNDSDLSPPRQSRNNDSDLSPPRQSKNDDSDLSPSRKNAKHRLSTHGGRSYKSSGNRDSDSDFSPPRKRKQNVDADLYESRKKDKGSHLSSARHRAHRSRRDNSPRSNSSRADREHEYSRNSSKQRRSSRDKRERKKDDYNHKPRSYSDTRERRKKSRWDEETDSERRHAESYSRDHDGRMTKTLDGKTAGLQDAKALREETRAHKQREAEQFNKLSKTVSGVGQAPIVRDKTGRKRNLEAEAAEEREREIQQREINEKYAKWGKGLKQMEDREEKMKNDLYEMSKPLARYADDADLDRELREQEREGDPMLKYIKQKQIKEGKRKPDPPQYRGSYAPNRFGVKPGHRWDGVDRSNGFEKKWFEAQNAKRARQEEAHKWSTADM